MINFNFDEFVALFAHDPEAAQAKADALVEDYISSLDADKQQRARAYHWRLQQELRHYKDPIARMNKMVELFWKGVNQFNAVLGQG